MVGDEPECAEHFGFFREGFRLKGIQTEKIDMLLIHFCG